MKKRENELKRRGELETITLNALKPIKKISVSEWADKYRQLPADSAEPGQWRTSRAPYMKAVMDAFTENEVHRVVVKSAAQLGKSESLLNVLGRYIHIDPCAAMLIQPTLEMAQDFSRSRLSKMIQDSKVLTPLFYEKQETILSKYFKGGRLVLAGANSAAGLASRPIRLLLCDEVDRFPESASGNEGDPVELAAKRTSNFWNYKIGLFSTPTTEGASRIDVEYKTGTQEEWSYECPNCGEYHVLDYRQMKAEYSESVDEYKNRMVIIKSVKWQCPDCGYEYGEMEMKNARQKYVARNPEAIKNGIRSFYLNGFSSGWLSWEQIMREYLEAKGDAIREQVVFNTRFGLSYKLRGEYDNENELLTRREDYAAELPQGVLLLTAGVDVQANRLEYEICGFGYGEECWGVLKGIVRGEPNQITTWQALDEVLDREYQFANGLTLKVARTFIDSGYATAAVYSYCRLRMAKGRFSVKGKGGAGMKLLHQYGYPKNAGVLLTILGVDDGKQEVMSRLGIKKPGAMYFHFPNDDEYLKRGYDAVYFKQLISEHKVMKKSGGIVHISWEPIQAKARNEALDCRIYALAAMKSCVGKNGAGFWKRQETSISGTDKSTQPLKVKTKERMTKAVDIW